MTHRFVQNPNDPREPDCDVCGRMYDFHGPRARLDALMRMLVDSGDMTPMAVQQFGNVLDESPFPDPEKLREIADHIDTMRRVLLPTWEAAVGDPHAARVVAALRNQAMQDDLRAWAAHLERLLGH